MSLSTEMRNRVFTVGHSNHAIEVFLRLLKEHHVDVIVDTRSQPRSKFAPQYDGEKLRRSLRDSGIDYVYLGRELGGRPEGAQFYDADGHVLYSRVAESKSFLDGLHRLEQGISKRRAALMCSEENPSICHRRLLIARVLHERGFAVDHIRANGAIQSEQQLMSEEAARADADPQLALFEHSIAPEWKSIPSVLPRRRQSSSSAS